MKRAWHRGSCGLTSVMVMDPDYVSVSCWFPRRPALTMKRKRVPEKLVSYECRGNWRHIPRREYTLRLTLYSVAIWRRTVGWREPRYGDGGKRESRVDDRGSWWYPDVDITADGKRLWTTMYNSYAESTCTCWSIVTTTYEEMKGAKWDEGTR